jgi:hypothetical protein
MNYGRIANRLTSSTKRGHFLSARWLTWTVLFFLGSVGARPTWCADLTPESPEVKALMKVGIERMKKEAAGEVRLGGKCLIALALIKMDEPTHPLVSAAVAECRQRINDENIFNDGMYSNGIAVMFLCEAGANRYRTEIQRYLEQLLQKQKSHGGWGYVNSSFGDTSQTQYAALALWTAHRNGFRIEPSVVARLADWLLKTQSPEGAWGYQGIVGESDRSKPQTRVSPCMAAAGLGSVLICADLLGTMPAYGAEASAALTELPDALKRGEDEAVTTKLAVVDFDYGRLAPAIEAGNNWFEREFAIRAQTYQNYYLYALERYKSFQELYDGLSPNAPEWYQLAYKDLKDHQIEGGGWESGCGRAVDCAFSVLCLYRSTQKIIRASLGEGTLTAGRGLPANIANAEMRQGQIVVQKVTTELDDMLALVDDERGEVLDQLASSSAIVSFQELDAKNARRLQQLVRSRDPSTRLLAVRTLGRSGNLDFVPTLIYALSDPDRRVVLEARDGLRFVSRRFDGFGLSASFDEKQRSEAIEKWKRWYLAMRPDTVFEQ